MLRDNAESARRYVDAWNRRDLSALLAMATDDIEYVNSPWAVEPGTRRGQEEFASVLRRQWDSLGDARLEIESMRATGDEAFLMMRMSRTVPGSEARVDARVGARFTYTSGRLVRQEVIAPDDFPEALEAAGLRG